MLQASQKPDVRQVCAVLLRKILTGGADPLWAQMSPSAKVTTISGMMVAVQNETVAFLRNNICDSIASISAELYDEGGVAAIASVFAFMQQAATGSNHAMQEVSLSLFERLAGIVATDMKEQFTPVRAIFLARLTDAAAPMLVRTAAARAVAALLISVQPSEAGVFAPLLPAVMQLLAESVQKQDDEISRQLSGVLCDVCDTQSSAFKPVLSDTVRLLTQVAGTAHVDSKVRRLCLECLVTIAEQAPALCRKLPHDLFLVSVLPVCFTMLLEHGDEEVSDAQWDASNPDDEDLDDDERQVEVAEEALQRIGEAIGQKRYLPAVFNLVNQYLAKIAQPSDWKFRAAALAAVRECAGIPMDDPESLLTIARQLCTHSADPHLRVRHAAVDALGSYCHFQRPVFQQITHGVTAAALIARLSDPSRRVRFATCVAVCSYCSDIDADIDGDCINPHIKDMLAGLFQNLNAAGDEQVQAHALTAVTCLGGAAGKGIGPYYSMIVPGLHAILGRPEPIRPSASSGSLAGAASPTTPGTPANTPRDSGAKKSERKFAAAMKQSRLLKGKALECLTVIGMATGIEQFRPDAINSLQGIVGILQSLARERAGEAVGTAADDPVQSYCWDAIGRLAQALGPDEFQPYLPHIVPPLLTAAKADSSITTVEKPEDDGLPGQSGGGDGSDDEDEDDGGEDGVAEMEGSDGKIVRVRTAEFEDKQSALDALINLFHVVRGPSIAAYAPSLLEAVLKALTLSGGLFDDIRGACCVGMEDIFATLASIVTIADLEGALAAGAGVEGATPPSTPGLAYLNALYTSISTLMKQTENEDSGEMLRNILAAFDTTLRAACGRFNFSGQPNEEQTPRDAMYLPLLRAPMLHALTQTLLRVRQEAIQRRAVRAAERKVQAEDLDEEALERMEEMDHDDGEIVRNSVDVIGTLIKTHRAAYMPVYSSLVAEVAEGWADPRCLAFDRRIAIFLFDDVLEHAGDAAVDTRSGSNGAHFTSRYIPVLIAECSNSDAPIQQASVYGLGCAAGSCPSTFPPFVAQAVQALGAVVAHFAKAGKRGAVHDNAVSSLLKIVTSHIRPGSNPGAGAGGGVDRRSVIDGIVSRLPLKDDLEEGRHVLETVCDMVNSRDPNLLHNASGQLDPSKIGSVIKAFAWAADEDNMRAGNDKAFNRLRAKIGATVRDLQSLLPREVLGAVWAGLEQKDQACLLAVASPPKQ